MQGKVEICGVNTAKLKVLKNEQIVELLQKARAGDQNARQELIEGNLKLVLSVIQRFLNRNENADDLFQVGCIGLIKAIDNFNPDMNVRFSTYGVPMIIGEVRRFLRDYAPVRVSRSLRDTAYRVLQAKEKLTGIHHREPTEDELAAELKISRYDVVEAMDSVMEPVSLYEPIFSDDNESACGMDQIRDTKNTAESWLEKIAIQEAMDSLSKREKNILSMRFYEGKTQMQVAKEIGISQAQVSRIEKNAVSHIKQAL